MFLHQTHDLRRFLSHLTKFDLELTPKDLRNINFDPTVKNGLKPMPLRRLLNFLSNYYSWVDIGVKTIEISWKPYRAHQLAS